MRTFAQKPKGGQQTASAKPTMPGRAQFGPSRDVNSILQLQQTIGNQAVQRMLQTHAEHLEGGLTSTPSPHLEHDFSQIPVHAKSQPTLQAKRTESSAGDSYEREADRAAAQVMRMSGPQLQRTCSCGGECPQCRAQQTGHRQESLSTKRIGTDEAGQSIVPPIVHEVLQSPGRPLDPATRAFMDPRFGYDFSGVRVHADAGADAASTAVRARAFTVGADVVFRQGELAPHTEAGRALLAHELAHVVQQGAAERPPARIAWGESGSTTAPALAAFPARGQPRLDRSMTAVTLQRQEEVPTSCDDREPDSGAVAGIIQDAYHGSRSSTYPVNELQDAWFHVRNQREQGGANCCSPELVAAEHYLYARYAVANRDHSPFEMKALIWGYGYLKFLVPKTGICPKSPDTQGSRDWGYRGADDGATDLFHQELAQNDEGQAEGNEAEATA